MKEPLNELERALAGALRGPQGNPELFRQLRAAELAFLLPYHPEMEGKAELKNGDAFPIVVWGNDRGQFVPVFTSMGRADEALETVKAGDRKYSVAEMKGQWLFEVLCGMKRQAVLNPACGTGEVYLNLKVVTMLADGSMFQPAEPPDREEGTVQIVNPADYPTDLLQPIFQFLRGRPEAKAAWLFERPLPPGAKDRYFVFAVLVAGDAKVLKQDFNVVGSGTSQAPGGFGVMVLDPKDPTHAELVQKFQPFYAAPDFRRPGPEDAK